MRKMKKLSALLLVLLLLAAVLAGCGSKKCVWCGKSFSGAGHDTGSGYVCDDCYYSLSGGSASSSGSNTGVWIAVTVMVFIAVFSATSGVVYLVLQKLLPPEKATPKSRRSQDYDYDDFQSPKPVAPRPTGSPQARPVNSAPRSSAENGMWICPRDKSRNSGPYCSVCGSNRPTAPRPVRTNPAAQRPQGAGSQTGRSDRPQAAERGGYQQDAYSARAQQPRAQQPVTRPQQPSQAEAYRQPVPDQRYQQPAAPVYREPVVQSRQPAEAPQKEYQGRFARREPAEEPEVDSELLAEIFRAAAEEPEE